MTVARNHAFAGAVNGKIYVIGGRTGHGFILSATNTDVVEEYNPVADLWSVPKERMPTARSGGAWGTDGRRIYVAGGEVTTQGIVGAFRAIEAYEPATNSWTTLPSMPMPRHGVAGAVIGNRFHLVSGMIQSAGAMSFLDPKLEVHTGTHDVLELQFNPSPPTGAKSEGTTSSAGPKKPYTRYNVNSPEGQVMLAKYARAIEIMRKLPALRSTFMDLVVEYPLDQGLPGVPVGLLQETQDGSHRVTPAGVSSRCRGRVERLPSPPLQPLRPRAVSTVVLPALASAHALSVRGGHSRGAAG